MRSNLRARCQRALAAGALPLPAERVKRSLRTLSFVLEARQMSDIEIITFGCRLNAYESEVMRQQRRRRARRRGDRQHLRGHPGKRAPGAADDPASAPERPDAKIVVTGCAAQIDPAAFAAMAEVDHVIGNQEKLDSGTFRALVVADTERVAVNDIMSVRETAASSDRGLRQPAPAPMCKCRMAATIAAPSASFPSGAGRRGRCRRARWSTQIRKLVENGYAEIVLTGVDMTA